MNKVKENKKVLLKVENLEQFFKLGRTQLRAVDGISFEVYKGEVFGLVGESGCGKTTTGRSIIRLYDITGGSVYFDGKRICAGIRPYKQAIKDAKVNNRKKIAEYKKAMKQAVASGANAQTEKEKYQELVKKTDEELIKVVKENTEEIKLAKYDHKYCNREFANFEMDKVRDRFKPLLEKETDPEKLKTLNIQFKKELRHASKDRIMNKIQMIFQDPIASLNPRMTVRDIIAEGLIIKGIKDKEYIDQQVYKILEMVGLVPEHATRYPHEFSGGQRQRIGVARAIILQPEFIIADEPISALDVSIQAQIINLLQDLSETMGLTTLFIAHDLSVVKYFSDRIAVMYYGKIVELATSEELFKHPLHPYTKSLLSAIPFPDPYFEKKRKRIVYNPLVDHEFSTEKPQMREILPGHFIYCNSLEFEKYKKEIKDIDQNQRG